MTWTNLFLAAGLFFSVSPGLAQTLYVVDASGGAGSSFKDLSKAVAVVPSGSFLYVRAGDYKPFHVRNKALHIRGEGVGKTRILLDENSGNVTVERLKGGEVFTFEDLSIEPGFYWGIPSQSPPAPRAPYLVLRLGTFFLRNVSIIKFNKGQYKGNQWVGAMAHGKGIVEVESAFLHGFNFHVDCEVAQRAYDSPLIPLPAGLFCRRSFLDLRGGEIYGADSRAFQSSFPIRSSGTPGLHLYMSNAVTCGTFIEGGHGSFSPPPSGVSPNVPVGNGGPGILLEAKSLLLLDGGAVRGGGKGHWQTYPFAPMHCGKDGPGLEIRKGCLVRSRAAKVEGGMGVGPPPGPVWTGKGVYRVFPGPVKRPALEWNLEIPSPDRGKVLFVRAPAGSSILLLASPRPNWIPLGPLSLFGTLYLDPAGLFTVGMVKVPSSGTWELPLGHPARAGIIGPWFLQAIRAPEGKHTITSNLVELVFWP